MGPPYRSRSQSAQRNESTQDKATNKNKRPLSPEVIISQEKTSKKSKTTTLSVKEMDEIKKLLGTFTASIENKIQESQTSLETKFNQLGTKVDENVQSLKTSVDEFKLEVSGEISDIKTQLNDNTQRIENTEDDIERLKRCCDLRLTGFPPKENEKLIDYLSLIAKEIGMEHFTVANAPTIERLLIKNKTTGLMMQSNTIMIHFNTLRQKQTFYSHYLNKMPIKSEQVG